jgi:hypothetical protein
MAKIQRPMSGRSAPGIMPILLVAIVLVTACGSPNASGSAPVGTIEPGTTPTGRLPADPSQPVAAGTSSPHASTSAEPPAAALKADGGDPVDGQLGSYTWNGGGSDSPWLQGSPIRVGAGEPLTVAIAGGPAIGDWTVQRVAGGTAGGAGAIAMGSGEGTPIAFIAPSAGSWSILVNVRFADGADAAYYWLLDVS